MENLNCKINKTFTKQKNNLKNSHPSSYNDILNFKPEWLFLSLLFMSQINSNTTALKNLFHSQKYKKRKPAPI